MTVYIIIAQDSEDWTETVEFRRDEPSIAQAGIVALDEIPPDWEIVSIQEAEYADQHDQQE